MGQPREIKYQRIKKPNREYGDDGSILYIYVDDEPLEHILYGNGSHTQDPVNLYLPLYKHVRAIEEACEKGDMEAVITASKPFLSGTLHLSSNICRWLAEALSRVFPDMPNPVISFDYTAFRPLLENMWSVACEDRNENLQIKTAPLLTRWYEYHGHYRRSLRIHMEILYLHHMNQDTRMEASTINNIGFVYLLEKCWKEAMHYFDEAAKRYHDLGIIINHANSRCNWWHCRFELGGWGEYESTKNELGDYAEILKNSQKWHARKPHILLARLEEFCGNLEEAISHVKIAIQHTTGSGTRYTEEDGKYLIELLEKHHMADYSPADLPLL